MQMKKRIALLLVLVLTLGCACAGAEQGMRLGLTLALPADSELRGSSLLSGLDGAQLILSILPGGVDLSLETENGRACLLQAVAEENGAALRSDVIPSFVLRAHALPQADAEAEKELTPLERRRNAQTEAQVQYIADLSRPYIEEMANFIEQVQRQTTFSEDYSVMTIELTAEVLNGMLDRVADCLRNDDALAEALDGELQKVSFLLPETQQLSALAIQSALADTLAGLRVPPDWVYATLRTRNHQDGTGEVELITQKGTAITYAVTENENIITARFGSDLTLSGDFEPQAFDLQTPSIPADCEVIELDRFNLVDLQRLLTDAQRNGILAAPAE